MTALYNNIAGLRNVAALVRLVDRVENRGASLPGMACFFGPSGWGKTTAAGYAANQKECHVVQCKSTWRTKKFLDATAQELGLKPARVVADVADQVSEKLARSGRTLLIDEADVLVNAKLVEVVRDIYESSGVGVILIGEEGLPQKLRQWERVHGRMLDWVPAQPGTRSDLEMLLDRYAPGVEIAEDLKGAVMEAAGPSIRRMCVNLSMVAERAKAMGVERMDKAAMGKTGFFTGQAPEPRRVA
jgi:DNA transposition AAA+ family ATPase